MAGYSDKEYKEHTKYLVQNPKTRTWRTETGHHIPFIMLNDDHIMNIIKMLKRRVSEYKTTLNIDPYTNLANTVIELNLQTIKELDIILKERIAKRTPAGKVLFGE